MTIDNTPTVILLSAGKGTRMNKITKNSPKCLLQIEDGFTVLESQLNTIKKAGIKDVIIVLGYLADQIEAKMQYFREDGKFEKFLESLNINVVYNPFYNTSNNLVSLWMAKTYMGRSFIIINGDNVFKLDVLKKVLESKHDVTMVIDKKSTYDSDDMKVVLSKDKNSILKIGKEIPLEETEGESVGIIKFQNGANKILKRTLDQMVREPKMLQVFYLQAIQRMIRKGYKVNFVEIPPNDWAEIDFHPDLQSVQDGQLKNFLETFD